MSSAGRAAGISGAALVMGALAPAVASAGFVRTALTPRLLPAALSGHGRAGHLALTYDDGPDRASTPAFLELLAARDVRATFFVLGVHADRQRGLVGEIAAAGHEVAVHGWDHRCVVGKRPGLLVDDLRRTADLVAVLTGREPQWYRPPYGVLSTESLLAAHVVGLRTVLWTAWGRDWEARATPVSVVRTVTRRPASGGTVLLHDSDRTSAPGSWRTTLAASATLLDRWTAAGLDVGPLAEHGVAGSPQRPGTWDSTQSPHSPAPGTR